MNKCILGFWCFGILMGILHAVTASDNTIWTTVVMPMMCLGMVGFKG